LDWHPPGHGPGRRCSLGDIEATFTVEEMGDKSLSLRCPTFVTDARAGQFASTFKNPNDKQMELMVRTDVSGHGGIRTERTTVTLTRAERKRFAGR